jgi:cell shape-determining protein MreC
MFDSIIIASVLAFLLGLAIGIAGYAFTAVSAIEKEIVPIFDRLVRKYEDKVSSLEFENKVLRARLEKRKEKKA